MQHAVMCCQSGSRPLLDCIGGKCPHNGCLLMSDVWVQVCQLMPSPLTLERHAELQGHSWNISCLAWLGDAQHSALLSGAEDQSVRLWSKDAWMSESLATSSTAGQLASAEQVDPRLKLRWSFALMQALCACTAVPAVRRSQLQLQGLR